MSTGKMTEQERDILFAQLRKATGDSKPREYTPRPRVRRPWLGTLNWERSKAKRAARRKARNIQARKARKAQRRAG